MHRLFFLPAIFRQWRCLLKLFALLMSKKQNFWFFNDAFRMLLLETRILNLHSFKFKGFKNLRILLALWYNLHKISRYASCKEITFLVSLKNHDLYNYAKTLQYSQIYIINLCYSSLSRMSGKRTKLKKNHQNNLFRISV